MSNFVEFYANNRKILVGYNNSWQRTKIWWWESFHKQYNKISDNQEMRLVIRPGVILAI